MKAGVALAADHLVAVVLLSQDTEGRLNDTTTETKDQVEGRLLLDVVVGKGAAVLQLLAGKDQTLLIWGDSFFVLNEKSQSTVYCSIVLQTKFENILGQENKVSQCEVEKKSSRSYAKKKLDFFFR